MKYRTMDSLLLGQYSHEAMLNDCWFTSNLIKVSPVQGSTKNLIHTVLGGFDSKMYKSNSSKVVCFMLTTSTCLRSQTLVLRIRKLILQFLMQVQVSFMMRSISSYVLILSLNDSKSLIRLNYLDIFALSSYVLIAYQCRMQKNSPFYITIEYDYVQK